MQSRAAVKSSVSEKGVTDRPSWSRRSLWLGMSPLAADRQGPATSRHW